MTVEMLTSELLAGTRHGFFTRRGGVSSGIYAELNCGMGSSDQRNAVVLNRARVAESLSIPPDRLLTLHQVHSADVVVADHRRGWPEPPRADAAVTDVPGVAVAVLTADCAPVLFRDAEAQVVAAAHAGWRGALGGILEATLEAMERRGARRSSIRAAVGPCISRRAYEVGPEMRARFVAEDPDYDSFFSAGRGDRFHFDLPAFALARLRAAGIAEAAWLGACTYSDSDRFFSYRRATHGAEPDYGRMISAIRL